MRQVAEPEGECASESVIAKNDETGNNIEDAPEDAEDHELDGEH